MKTKTICFVALIVAGAILAGVLLGSLVNVAIDLIQQYLYSGEPGVLYAQIETPDGKIVRGVCSEYTYSASGGVMTLIVDNVLYYAHPSNVLLTER